VGDGHPVPAIDRRVLLEGLGKPSGVFPTEDPSEGLIRQGEDGSIALPNDREIATALIKANQFFQLPVDRDVASLPHRHHPAPAQEDENQNPEPE
jgi:hypothetical protein